MTDDALARTYLDMHRASIESPDTFWRERAQLIDWDLPPREIRDTGHSSGRWFADGRLNTCFNAVDRHVLAGRGDHVALIHDSAYSGTVTRTTYSELLEMVAAFAGGLRELGVDRGDRVVIYLPMVPEAVVAMLACARIGAIHSVVFGGFAAHELAARMDDLEPSLLVTATCGIEPSGTVAYLPIVDRAMELSAFPPPRCVVLSRPELQAELTSERYVDWASLVALGAKAPADPVSVESTHPLYVLYTSGTTGKPKGIVRDSGGHAVAMAWSFAAVYGMGPDSVWWAASDIGWVVGHSYIVYGPLISGATTILYEGKPVGTPDAGAFGRVLEQHRVNALFTAPTALRAIRKADPEAALLRQHDLSAMKMIFLAGERLDPATYEWAGSVLEVPVIDNWWQTETGWPIASNLMGVAPLPTKPGSPSVPVPGFDVRILDSSGNEVDTGEEGAVCIRLPLPPGSLSTVWRDHDRFEASYLSEYPGYYRTGDAGFRDEDGYLFVMGRTDDVINVAGHRLSTGAMEAVVSQHTAVAECAVVGIADPLKGQVPHGFVVLKDRIDLDESTVKEEVIALVREKIGPVASFKDVTVVPALPKTRSGKILRRSIRDIVEGADVAVPSTIEDATVLETLTGLLR